tara:strand:+ start:375 stop:686 length:312 start_codon:yes stop_codon:yes gene_type:complete
MRDLTGCCTPYPNTFQIPSYIRVGGHVITVVRKQLDQNVFGTFDPETMEIAINPSSVASIEEETFWHEVVEVLNCLTEAGLEHKSIQSMGVFLHQIINSCYGE